MSLFNINKVDYLTVHLFYPNYNEIDTQHPVHGQSVSKHVKLQELNLANFPPPGSFFNISLLTSTFKPTFAKYLLGDFLNAARLFLSPFICEVIFFKEALSGIIMPFVTFIAIKFDFIVKKYREYYSYLINYGPRKKTIHLNLLSGHRILTNPSCDGLATTSQILSCVLLVIIEFNNLTLYNPFFQFNSI
jgi:hypothetical protein